MGIGVPVRYQQTVSIWVRPWAMVPFSALTGGAACPHRAALRAAVRHHGCVGHGPE